MSAGGGPLWKADVCVCVCVTVEEGECPRGRGCLRGGVGAHPGGLSRDWESDLWQRGAAGRRRCEQGSAVPENAG